MKSVAKTVTELKNAMSHNLLFGNQIVRGFNPASEDDMDDNGMSRYMENTDDEGWD